MNQPELIVQLKAGDEQAFTRLVEEYQDMVYNTVLGIVQHADDADDITQEVFIQVYQSVSSFKGDSKFSTWLYRIAVSKALDFEKKQKRKKRFGFMSSIFGSDEAEQSGSVLFEHPGVQLENKESAGELFRALKQIPENQRIAFTLHKMEGLSHQEIAAVMNSTVAAVESLMGRAKLSLRKELNRYYKNLR